MSDVSVTGLDEPSRQGDIRYLLTFTLLILGVAGFASTLFMLKPSLDVHWMVPAAIAIMSIFIPLTAISFLSYRLPQKQKEFKNILKALNPNHEKDLDMGERASFVLNQDFRGVDYLLPVMFNTLFSILGFYILFANDGLVLLHAMEWVNEGELWKDYVKSDGEAYSVYRIYRQGLVALGFAFLGAYIWSVQYLFRRMVTLDMPPGAYYNVGTRLVYSSFLALMLSHLMYWGREAETGMMFNLDQQLPVAAFLAGIFPERLLNWLRDSVPNIFGRSNDHADSLPLEMVEGISSYHKARLAELGIDNLQNLAHASLVELIVKTPYKPRVLADWMAQARLCLEFKEHTQAIRAAGVRSILDLQDIYNEQGSLAMVAQESGVSIGLIDAVYAANAKEESINRLRDAYDRLSVV